MSSPGSGQGTAPTEAPKAAGIGPSTVVQKILHPALAAMYLGNVRVLGRFEPHRTAGLVVRGQDVVAGTADAVAETYGMDKVAGWPMGGPVYVLRYVACSPALYATSFGGQTADSAAKMGSNRVYPAPFLGTGYTPSATPVAEYVQELSELVAGTELWRIEQSGEQSRVARYVNRQIGWVATGDVEFGPARWWSATAIPLRPGVRRGLVASFRGQSFDVDFGPAPGELVLHPMPGAPAPEDFEQRENARFRVIADVQVDELLHLRQLCTWRGAPFELIDAFGEQAVLHYLGEDYQQAAQLGLVEVDFRVWRTVVPRGEVSEPHEERRVVGRGVFAAN